MQAVVFVEPGKLKIAEVPEPELSAPTDAVVRITRAALCGSDLHILHGDMPQTPGQTVGHEYTGVVEAVGEGVSFVQPGDRVVGAFHIACGHCPPCRARLFHQCRRGGVLGYGPQMGDLPGIQAEYARIPFADENLRVIPEGMDEEAALFCGDNLPTVYGALANVGLAPGETVAVVGCGPIGLQAIQTARAMGAGRVLATDLVPSRVAKARELGAEAVDGNEADAGKEIRAMTGKRGADVVLEAVGGPATLDLAFRVVAAAGRISAVGVSNQPTYDFPLLKALTRDLTFRIGLANVHRDWDRCLDMVAAGSIDPTAVVSHRLPLARALEAYDLFDRREAEKVLLTVGG